VPIFGKREFDFEIKKFYVIVKEGNITVGKEILEISWVCLGSKYKTQIK